MADMLYKIVWPSGIGEGYYRFSWDQVVEDIEEAAREGIRDNEQALTEGEGFPEDEYEETIERLAKPYMGIEQVDEHKWQARVLSETGYPASNDRYFTIHIYEEPA